MAGLSWSANAPNQGSKPTANNTPAIGSYPSLRPSPSPFASGRNTPLSTQGSGSSGPKPAAKPAQDSFSNLLNLGASKPALSLKEQQERLEAEKRRKEEERRKNAEAQYGGHFLDSLGSGGTSRTSSPAVAPPPSKPGAGDDDLFAAFLSETKVDNSSFYPPPSRPSQPTTPAPGPALDLGNPAAWNQPPNKEQEVPPEDDDPFGLGQLKSGSSAPPPAVPASGADQEDDFLGDLGRPVEEIRKKQQSTKRPAPGKPIEVSESDSDSDNGPVAREADPFDKAVAQLVDYGFSADNSRRALTESGAGLNVQAAVNWLLDDAHRQANAKAKGKARQPASGAREASPAHRPGGPARVRGEDPGARRSRDNQSPASGNDLAETATAMGTTLFKMANTLWKNGQKKMQQAVAEYQYEGDPNQPKWMRSAQQEESARASEKRPNATDEAMMLDSGMRPERKAGRESRASPQPPVSRERSPAVPQPGRHAPSQPKWQQPGRPVDPRSRVDRLALESDDLPKYVSPNRRRKGTPASPAPFEPREAPAAEEPDLLFGGSSAPSTQIPHRPSQKAPAPAAKRPSAPASKPAPRPTPRP
ncbi:hypothetical protein IMZ48_37655, partial [Candidatus Bathyarchaeota archaeon]|nr:hypothetical protein [Candidatus Bathyarchaeota archaeon]